MEVTFKFPLATAPAAIIAAIAAHYGMSKVEGMAAGAGINVENGKPLDTTEDNTPNPTPPTVDAEHLPWDVRIHSETKALTDKGVWRKRRGVDAVTVANVTAELKGRVASHPAASQATVQANQPPAAPAAPGLPALTPPGLPPVAPPAKTAFDQFVDFTMQHIQTAANPTGRITTEWIGDVLKHYGIPEGTVSALQSQPDEKIAAIRAGIAQALGLPVGS